MRTAAFGSGLLALAFVLGVVFLWPTARTGPEPIVFGRDACAHCRMHLSQPGFGGEMRDARGALTKYDDVGCLVRAMLARHGEIPEAWVEDHETGRLVALLTAHLVRGQPSATPMGSGIVAFEREDAADAFARATGGRPVTLEELVREPARLAREEVR